MLRCCECHAEKPDEEFHRERRTTRGRSYRCKTCKRAKDRAKNTPEKLADARRRLNAKRDEVNARFKNVPCMDCGVRYPSYVMDFDHRDPSTKLFNIATELRGCYITQRILDEIAKCDVVCANCHRERSFGRHKRRAA